MLGFFKGLLTDEKRFVRLVRGLAMGAGGAVSAGQVPMVPEAWGVMLLVIGGAIVGGDKNPPAEGGS